MIALAAKLARKAGRRALASRLARLAADLRPGSAAAFSEYCSDRMFARDFEAIAARCESVASRRKASEALKEAASSWLARSRIEDDADPGLLARLRCVFRARGAATAEAFANEEFSSAAVRFAEALSLAGAPSVALPEWIAAFEAAGSVAATAPKPSRPASRPEGDASAPVRKLVVSGMYWSGSGALYDYLREFKEIVPIPGELRLWKEGDFCLSALAASFGDAVRFRDRLFLFLTKALAGTAPISAWKDVLASRYALSALRSDRDGLYARACRGFVEEAAAIAAIPAAGDADLAAAASRFSDSLARAWAKGRDGIALFDNAVHLGDVGAIRLFGEATALCSFRDPRSNFVARWRENPRFHRDAGRYIEYYRGAREGFERALASFPTIVHRVRRVSFERFILSEDYRDAIAAECGLNLSARKRGRYFKPDSSRRNIENYLDFPERDAIRRIERELGEYCVDISALAIQNGESPARRNR